MVESEVIKYQIYRNYLNHDLDEMAAIMNRQKLATLDAFANQFGANKVFLGFEQDYIWMSTDEAVQYHIDTFNSQKDFQFGLDIETQPNVKRNFTKFASTTNRAGGTGLGLYIAKAIVDAHGGRIWAENNKDGKGASFSFILPIQEANNV